MQQNTQQPSPYPNIPPAPPTPPNKKGWWRKKIWKLPVWAWIIVAFLVVALIQGVSGQGIGTPEAASTPTAVTQPTAQPTTEPTMAPTTVPTPTTKPTQAPAQWHVLKQFSGHLSGGNWYYSPYFTVLDNWQVSWQAPNRDPSYPLVNIVGYGHNGNPIPGDDDIAAHGNASDDSGVGPVQKHGGTIQLQIYAQGDWNVEVSAQK